MADHDPRLTKPLAGLTLAALGVVYGDIGTSPLYAAKETFNPDHGIPLSTANVLGGLSAIFWSLMIVVSLKYVILIMGIIHRKRRSGSDFVLKCTRITVRPSSVTMNATTSTIQKSVEQERQATIR